MSAIVDTTPLDQFNTALADYWRFTGKEQGPLIEDRARKVRFELWRQFKALAPDPSRLKAQLEAIAKNRGLKRRIGPDSLVVSTAKEIEMRLKSVKFLSVSFLIKAWKSKQEGQSGRFYATARRSAIVGSATVNTKIGLADPSVLLTSFLDGVEKQNARHSIADSVLAAQALDMEQYLKRKHEEKLFRIASRAVSIALPA